MSFDMIYNKYKIQIFKTILFYISILLKNEHVNTFYSWYKFGFQA